MLPADFCSFAEHLADLARAQILPRFRSGLAMEDKDDHSPVTEADREAERVMRKAVQDRFSDHGIIGEEFGNERADAEWVWVFDPVDGTKSFVVGRPSFCTLIGLLHRGTPVLGIIDQAVLGERWIGVANQSTTLNGQQVHCRTINSLAHARLGATGPQYLTGPALHAFSRLQAACRFTVWGGDAYLFALLSIGGYDLVVEHGLKLHDFAALAPVVSGAGGCITDWQGAPLTQTSAGDVVASANPALHQQALLKLQAN